MHQKSRRTRYPKWKLEKIKEQENKENQKIKEDLVCVIEAITKAHKIKEKTGDVSGRMTCPKCGVKDALGWSISRTNGHVWGKCKTNNCLQWIQ